MWNFDSNYNRWVANDDKLLREDFDLLKQELQSVRFWSKCLSGATYLPVNDLSNIYEILDAYQPRNWYISNVSSPYSVSIIPSKYASVIGPSSTNPLSGPATLTPDTTYDFYTKNLAEYGLTLKNLFTPTRLIKDSLSNYNYVDVATTEPLDLFQITEPFFLDGVRVLEGHKVLVKNQVTNTTLLNSEDPENFIISNYTIVQNLGATIEYQYFNEENGIYTFTGGRLVRDPILDNYKNCIRFSVNVKLGSVNTAKQFHLSRLLDGFFPTTALFQPIEFTEKTNYILRNRVDYNNLFETNYYDIVKYGTQSYFYEGITYSIPQRTIAVGEFGIINNTQEGKSNIIKNKYKQDLKGISQTTTHYWICGNDNTLLKVRKHDFVVERIPLEEVVSINPQIIKTNLYSVSFIDDLKGVVVGELNTIFVTKNGGYKWERIELSDFDSYDYTKVFFDSITNFFITGKNGIFIEMVDTIAGWVAYKKRISKIIDDTDEYILVDDINDLYRTNINSWSTSYAFATSSIPTNKELIFLVTNNSGLIIYDKNNSFSNLTNDFIYLDFGQNYGDIRNISRRGNTNEFYFSANVPISGEDAIFSFNISDFPVIGTGSSYSNTAVGLTFATFESERYTNEIYDFEGSEFLICGNNALLESSTYGTFSFNVLDSTFEDKLKSKLLFLDYDIASKLNFFTDDGVYRMPNSITFSNTAIISTGSYVDFKPLIIAATAPSFLTQSETNWFTYWSDRQKTFEFYTNTPMDESVTVRISSSFSYSPISASYSINTITSSASQINYLAPTINYATQSRFDSQGLPSISAPTAAFDLYLYKYLMVARVSTTFPASKGDIIRFNSSVVQTDLMINKIVTLSGVNYLYMFSEFNDNIIKDLTSTTFSVTMINLNKYGSLDDLVWRINEHPISNGYKLEFSDIEGNSSTSSLPYFKISTVFNNLTSYYNLATNIVVNGNSKEMKYTSGFLNFGYSPTYNILSYLESINQTGDLNPTFFATKEYLILPEYRSIPVGPLSDTGNVYIETNGLTYSGGAFSLPGNKILFGTDLYFEWTSIMKNTFIDVIIYGSVTYSATNGWDNERMLVVDKYFDENFSAYVLELHKNLEFNLGDPNILNGGSIDIVSRRKLKQISDDLQELNNIQRPKLKKESFKDSNLYTNFSYERELNFKINTDSYAKALLSDVETIDKLSAIIYTDDKYELAMNITRLAQEYTVNILNTSQTGVGSTLYSAGRLFISCEEEHGLNTGEGVVLEFTGATGSSQEVNQQYFGYHPVIKVTPYDLVIDIPYGNTPLVGNDVGTIKFTKQDPFFNYQPIDLIEYGVDNRGKQSIELTNENLILSGDIYSLNNVDFDKFRFRLVDGLNLEIINANYPWLLEAEISGAVIGIDQGIIWYQGTWECGRWFGGTWMSGVWMSGDWYAGTWNSYITSDKKLSVTVDTKTEDNSRSIWYDGRWFDGTWNNGIWNNGRWYSGTWNNGIWYNGTWNDGLWNKGQFQGGIWVLGTWQSGIFNCNNGPAYWLDGKWSGGDFENGMWYNGTWEQKNGLSRFGTKSFNSRTSTWQGGKWLSGSFYSKLETDSEGALTVSESHKLSIWKTGLWTSGDWYGGVAYNMDWKLGTWYGGILEDIQVVGINTTDDYFTLNGVFKFNIGDSLWIIDNQVGGSNSVFGSNAQPIEYKVIYAEDFASTKTTNVYVNYDLSSLGSSVSPMTETNLRVVSIFKNINWKSGIWSNGIYTSGLWEGGIWYNGIFEGTWM